MTTPAPTSPPESALDRLRLALQAGGVGFWELDLQTRQLHLSDDWKKQLGYAADDLPITVANWQPLVHPADRDRLLALGSQTADRGQSVAEIECRLRHRNGAWRWMLVRWAVARTADGQRTHLVGCTIDITRRKQTEDALIASEERYRRFIETIPHLAWRCSPDGLTIDCNHRWYEYTGQSPDEAFATGWQRAVHPDDLARTQQRIADVVGRGVPYETEYRLRRALDGAYRWHLARALPLRDAEGKITEWFGSATDIDDRKRAEQDLRNLSTELERRVGERTEQLTSTVDQLQAEILERQELERALLEITSQERQRIGQDLHDGLCQQIAGVALMIKALEKTLARDRPALAAKTAKIEHLLTRGLLQARELARSLCALGPEGGDLRRILRELAASSQTLFSITCTVNAPRPIRITDPEIASHLYHVAQEAISNAVRHGRADRLRLSLHRRAGSLVLEIRDNGTGFDPDQVQTNGLGLRLMRHRARVIGGRLELVRAPDGMCVRCVCPAPRSPRRRR